MIHLDTSTLIAATNPASDVLIRLERIIADGEPMGISSIVLYEWLRGPRTRADLLMQGALHPGDAVCAFGSAEAAEAAAIYRRLPRARPREIDIAIAACAVAHRAALWTLNPQDFRDIPGLRLLHATS